MTDRDAFLKAICDSPQDMAPRLTFADWLDEQGTKEDADRAAEIRESIASGKVDFSKTLGFTKTGQEVLFFRNGFYELALTSQQIWNDRYERLLTKHPINQVIFGESFRVHVRTTKKHLEKDVHCKTIVKIGNYKREILFNYATDDETAIQELNAKLDALRYSVEEYQLIWPHIDFYFVSRRPGESQRTLTPPHSKRDIELLLIGLGVPNIQ